MGIQTSRHLPNAIYARVHLVLGLKMKKRFARLRRLREACFKERPTDRGAGKPRDPPTPFTHTLSLHPLSLTNSIHSFDDGGSSDSVAPTYPHDSRLGI